MKRGEKFEFPISGEPNLNFDKACDCAYIYARNFFNDFKWSSDTVVMEKYVNTFSKVG